MTSRPLILTPDPDDLIRVTPDGLILGIVIGDPESL
jgi:hypothetical protein